MTTCSLVCRAVVMRSGLAAGAVLGLLAAASNALAQPAPDGPAPMAPQSPAPAPSAMELPVPAPSVVAGPPQAPAPSTAPVPVPSAAASSAEAPTPTPEVPAEPLGITLGVGIESAYYFRGLNVFRRESQRDQNFLFEPSLTYDILHSGLTIGYWGGYQVNGDNAEDLIAAGVGHEQDVILRYAGEVAEGLTLAGSATAYFYPFADADAAGCDVPLYLEPGVSLAYAGPLDLAFAVSHMVGVQEALEGYRYAYFNPSVGKTFDLGSVVDLAFALGFGFKAYNTPSTMPDNRFDVRFDWGAPLDLGGGLTVTPAVHMGWTDFDAGRVGDGYFVWGSLLSSLAL